MRPLIRTLAVIALAWGCREVDDADTGIDAGTDAPLGMDAPPATDAPRPRDAPARPDIPESDAPRDGGGDPAFCQPVCETHADCRALCPAPGPGRALCCDPWIDRCYLAGTDPCPYSCPTGCVTDDDCNAACPPERGVACCEPTTGTCTLRDEVTGSCSYPDAGGDWGGV